MDLMSLNESNGQMDMKAVKMIAIHEFDEPLFFSRFFLEFKAQQDYFTHFEPSHLLVGAKM